MMSLIAAYLFILGFSTRNTDNETLGRALMVGGAIIFGGILLAWILAWKRDRRDIFDKEN